MYCERPVIVIHFPREALADAARAVFISLSHFQRLYGVFNFELPT